jgi:hypothetical protein
LKKKKSLVLKKAKLVEIPQPPAAPKIPASPDPGPVLKIGRTVAIPKRPAKPKKSEVKIEKSKGKNPSDVDGEAARVAEFERKRREAAVSPPAGPTPKPKSGGGGKWSFLDWFPGY